jgi:hypothetical protein
VADLTIMHIVPKVVQTHSLEVVLQEIIPKVVILLIIIKVTLHPAQAEQALIFMVIEDQTENQVL